MKLRLLLPFLIALPLWSAAEELAFDPIDTDSFEDMLTASAFTRVLDHTSQLVLTGIAEVDGQTIVTLYNRDTKESSMVGSDKQSEKGFRVVEIMKGRRGEAFPMVRMAVGMNQQVTLRFDEVMASPRNARGGQSSGKGGPPRPGGQPAQKGGYVQAPQDMMKKYYSLNKEQKEKFTRWTKEYYQKNPGMKGSDKRFPVVNQALEAAQGRGQFPK